VFKIFVNELDNNSSEISRIISDYLYYHSKLNANVSRQINNQTSSRQINETSLSEEEDDNTQISSYNFWKKLPKCRGSSVEFDSSSPGAEREVDIPRNEKRRKKERDRVNELAKFQKLPPNGTFGDYDIRELIRDLYAKGCVPMDIRYFEKMWRKDRKWDTQYQGFGLDGDSGPDFEQFTSDTDNDTHSFARRFNQRLTPLNTPNGEIEIGNLA